MIELPCSLVIEATEEPDDFGFFSPDLDGFTGIGHSVEDGLYKAKWGMWEHVELLRERGLPVPLNNPNPKIVILNAKEQATARLWLLLFSAGWLPWRCSERTTENRLSGTCLRSGLGTCHTPAWSWTTRGRTRYKLCGAAHTHVALDDAIGQGALFCNMLDARRRRFGGIG